MRKLIVLGAAAALALTLAVVAFADDGNGGRHAANDALTLAVYGDAPYGTSPTDTAEFDATPAFVAAINADPAVDLVLHVGDIHSGKQFCTQAYDQSIFDLWSQYVDPVVYTPGDNEWSDCHKSGEGGNKTDSSGNPVDYANGDPIANLALIRQIFFPHPSLTLGQRKQIVISQAVAYDRRHPSDRNYPENVLWLQKDVLFVTVNIPGGSNNDADPWYGAPVTPAQTQEQADRTGADLRWLDTAFLAARLAHARAVVIGTQADMWDTSDAPSHQTNYEPFVSSIAQHTLAFRKPVLLFNGDSHTYRSDDPLVQGSPCAVDPGSGQPAVPCTDDAYGQHPGYDVPNFHRVVVHGSTFPLEYLRLTVSTHGSNPTTDTSFGPFSWERVQP